MKTKLVRMDLTVRVQHWMTAEQARREVRTMINEQCGYMSTGPMELGWPEVTVRVSKLRPAARKVTVGTPIPPRPRPPKPGMVVELTEKERDIARALYPNQPPGGPDAETRYAGDKYRWLRDLWERAVRDGRGYIVPIDGDETNRSPKNLALVPT